MNDLQFNKLNEKFSNFSYNGDLGRLQHQTKEHLDMAEFLAINDNLTKEQYFMLKNNIIEYFTNEMKKVVEKPFSYLN